MKKPSQFFLATLVLAALLTGCGFFSASPVISSFTADSSTINAGDSVTFTVKGSTKDPNITSDLVDYSATLKINSTEAGISEELTVNASEAEGFELTKTVQFSKAGTYTITANLITETDSVSKELTITVADPKPWDDADAGEPYNISSGGSYTTYYISPAGDIDWFKLEATSGAYYIHWQDEFDSDSGSSYSADVKVSVYSADGEAVVENQDAGYASSVYTYGAGSGIKAEAYTHYTLGEYIYIKVEGYYSTSSGTYGIYIY